MSAVLNDQVPGVKFGFSQPIQMRVDELVAGVKAKGEFRCAGCGYGISIYGKLPRCPMCGTESWEPLQWTFGPGRSDS